MRDEIPGIALEDLITAEYAALRRRFEERLAPLLVERALRGAAVAAAAAVPDVPAMVGSPCAREQDPRAVPAARRQAPRGRAHTAQLVIDTLWDAPGHRLPGSDLSRVVTDAGYTHDAAEKVKTRLKNIGVLIRHPGIGFWSLVPHVLEPGAVIPAFGPSGTVDGLGGEDGRAIVEALTDAGQAGLAGEDLVRAMARRGVPPSRTIQARSRLRATGHVVCGHGPGARWRIAGASLRAEPIRPQSSR